MTGLRVERLGDIGPLRTTAFPYRLDVGRSPLERWCHAANDALHRTAGDALAPQFPTLDRVIIGGRDIGRSRSDPALWNETASIDAVCDTLDNDVMPPGRVAVFSADSQRLDPAAYRTTTDHSDTAADGRIDNGRLGFYLTAGGSLSLQRASDLSPKLREIVRWICWLTGAQVTVNVYLSLTDHSGLGTHWDEHDVLVAQIEGRKHWSVYEPSGVSPLRERAARHGLPTVEPPSPTTVHVDAVLEPGDVMFVPRGTWHRVTAIGEPSLHATFAISYALALDAEGAPRDDPSSRVDLRPFDTATEAGPPLPTEHEHARRQAIGRHVAECLPTPTTPLRTMSAALLSDDLDGWRAAWTGGLFSIVDHGATVSSPNESITVATAGRLLRLHDHPGSGLDPLFNTSVAEIDSSWFGDAHTTRVTLSELALDGLVDLIPPGTTTTRPSLPEPARS